MTNVQPDLRAIFCAALERQSPAEIAQFLDSACGNDAETRAQVEALLASHQAAGMFLGGTSSGEPVTLDRPVAERPGAMIGSYKLLEQIGEGGMGLVYMAEQQQPVRRLVALKLVKPGMDTKQVIARFEAERQALAMMDHPNIAKVHDAGTTEAGRPYFVMELVRGIPVNEFCDQQKLIVRQRLELFIQVCQAIQHAHQKGIIHRDLKPTNVLVTKADTAPLPKVIDFGIAKALGPSLTDHTLHTGFAQLVGTPMYMSPEQAEMNHFGVDTRSDVYSLGVLLYELLTGTTPFDKVRLKSVGFDEMRRIIREEEPETVSQRIAKTRRVGQGRPGDRRPTDNRVANEGGPASASGGLVPPYSELDWIVMKALEKDRSRRYESASALAADIQRYLSDEPVLACPPTTMYRFQKFARKHKAAFTTAAAIAACLILGTTVSAWQAVRATTAEGQANANEQRAVANEQKAVANEQKAVANAAAAEQKEQEAIKQRDEVQALNEKLQATQAELRETLYGAHMNLANYAWQDGRIYDMNWLLRQYYPQSDKVDLRGFEWYYLHRLRNSQLLSLRGHTGQIESVAYSSDGNRLATACLDKTVRVFDANSGQRLLVIENGSTNVAFSPDGNRLASGTKVWDAKSGQELLTLPGAGTVLAFSPDGKRLAGTSATRPILAKVWDAQTGEELLTLGSNDNVRGAGGVQSVAFSPDGKQLVTSGFQAKVWDAQTGAELLSLKRNINKLVFSPDGKRLAGISGNAKVWDAKTGNELLSLSGHRPGMSCLAFSPDGLRLAGGSADNSIIVWDTQNGHELTTIKGLGGGTHSLAFSPDGKRLAGGGYDPDVRVWQSIFSPGPVVVKGGRDSVWGLAFSPDGKRLASATYENTVKLWDAQTGVGAETGKDLLVLKGHSERVWSVAFSLDGKRLASGSLDKTVKVWDSQTGGELRTLNGHTGVVRNVVFSPDGEHLASASDDRTIKVWNLSTGEVIHSFAGRQRVGLLHATFGLAFSPDGKRLAGGSGDQLKVWSVTNGEELFSWKDPDWLLGLAFSPDGKYLARAGREIKIWDVQTGAEHRSFYEGSVAFSGLAYSRDGRRIASVAYDGMVRIWNVETGHQTLMLTGHLGRVINVAFSPDGHRLATNGSDGTVRIWDATPLRLGIDPGKLPGLVIDDDAAEKQGSWASGMSAGGCVGEGWLHDNNQRKGKLSATYKFAIKEPGLYDVRISYTPGSARASNVPISIEHSGGLTHVTLDERTAPKIDETFQSVGQFRFEKQAVITISNAGTDGTVVIDAMQLLPAK